MSSAWRLHRSNPAPDRLRIRGFARALVIGGASLTLLLASVVANPARGEDGFAVGSGRATAKLLKIGPSRGALTLAPSVGVALSDFLVTRGRGDVRTADYAALEDSIPAEIRNGLPSVKVESTDEKAEEGRTATLASVPAPAKIDGARLEAAAGKEPFGSSSFTAGAVDLGVGVMSGGRAQSRSGVVDGKTREAVGTVVVPRLELAGGAVVLENLRWQATQRSGAQETNEAVFTIGAAVIAGQKLTAPDGGSLPIADVAAAIRPVLAPTGVEVTFPEPKIEAGAVSLTPLRLRVSASALAPSLVPVTDAIQPGREAVIGSIKDQTDDADAALLLGDIALGVIAGGSTLDIEIGGASATTAPPAAGFAFGSAGGFKLGVDGTGVSLGSAGGSSLGSAGTEDLGAADGGAPSSDASTSGGSDTGGDGREIAAAPAASVGERGGPMLAVGLIGLMIAGLTAAADYRKLRIGRRVIPG